MSAYGSRFILYFKQPLIFFQRSHPNEMLTGLRYFERPIRGSDGNLTKVSVYCRTGNFYKHLIFAIFSLLMIAPKKHPSNENLFSNKFIVRIL